MTEYLPHQKYRIRLNGCRAMGLVPVLDVHGEPARNVIVQRHSKYRAFRFRCVTGDLFDYSYVDDVDSGEGWIAAAGPIKGYRLYFMDRLEAGVFTTDGVVAVEEKTGRWDIELKGMKVPSCYKFALMHEPGQYVIAGEGDKYSLYMRDATFNSVEGAIPYLFVENFALAPLAESYSWQEAINGVALYLMTEKWAKDLNEGRYRQRPAKTKGSRAPKPPYTIKLRGGEEFGVLDRDVPAMKAPDTTKAIHVLGEGVTHVFAYDCKNDSTGVYLFMYSTNMPTPQTFNLEDLPEPKTYIVRIHDSSGESFDWKVAKRPGDKFTLDLFGRSAEFECVGHSDRVFEYREVEYDDC